jgi:predicted phage tail protein
MKTLLRFAAITVASTALVAGGAVAATAAPTTSSVVSSTAAPVATSGDPVSIAVAPYPVDPRTEIRVRKLGKKLTFKIKARYINDAGQRVGIRRATIQVKRGGNWRTVKRVKLNSKGRATYKRSDKKKRLYRLVIKATSVYQGGTLPLPRKI